VREAMARRVTWSVTAHRQAGRPLRPLALCTLSALDRQGREGGAGGVHPDRGRAAQART